jgi:hypothetical protein
MVSCQGRGPLESGPAALHMALPSSDLDDHLAEGATFTVVGQRLGHLFESKPAIDVDLDLA